MSGKNQAKKYTTSPAIRILMILSKIWSCFDDIFIIGDEPLKVQKKYCFYILIGKWIVHFNYADKNLKIKAENAAGVVPPARLSNADI